jgi:predicted heme/steroid binding protein
MASELRARTHNSSSTVDSSSLNNNTKPQSRSPSPRPPPSRLTLLSIVRPLLGLLLLSSTLSYLITGTSLIWNYPRPAFTRPVRIRAWLRGPLLLSPSELSLYNGSDPNLPIYLGLNGSIYDVSVSPHFYGPGGSYGFFAGRDATRAYVTGCFEEDLTGDLRGVEEIFVPVDEEEEGGGGGGAGMKEETREEKRERKLRREREWRIARASVRDVVRGWERMFDGGKGGKYFWVGRIKREEGWEEREGPVRELCQKAREQRPKRDKDGSQ